MYSCSPVEKRCHGTGGFDAGVAVVVVRREGFFDPADPVGADGICEIDRVGNIKRHIAIEHEIEIGADLLAGLRDHLDIGVQPFVAVGWSVGQWHFAAEEPSSFAARVADR